MARGQQAQKALGLGCPTDLGSNITLLCVVKVSAPCPSLLK